MLHGTRITTLARLLLCSRGPFVLVLHGVPPALSDQIPESHRPDLTVRDLRSILEWLRPRFAFLTVEECLAARKPGVLLTFDDGFANNATTVLPLLEHFEAPAVFFVATQHVVAPRDWLHFVRQKVERWPDDAAQIPESVASDLFDGMSLQQLSQCAAHPLVTIGSHTVSHPTLTLCSDADLLQELCESKRFLEETTGRPVDLLAYPRGEYDRRVVEAAAASGYKTAFALDSRHLGIPRFEVPRVGLYGSHPAYLDSKLCGLHRRPLGPALLDGRSRTPSSRDVRWGTAYGDVVGAPNHERSELRHRT